MARANPQTEVVPSPLDHQDLLQVEDMLRYLAVPQAIIERCKRCKIPCDEACADLEALVNFFQGVLAEFKGPQAPIGG